MAEIFKVSARVLLKPVILTVDPHYATYPVLDNSLEKDIPKGLKIYKPNPPTGSDYRQKRQIKDPFGRIRKQQRQVAQRYIITFY